MAPALDLAKEYTYTKEQLDSLETEYKYPFENLVFRGGGVKGGAYVGALQILNDVGILPRIKRYAGSSVGSLTAALLAVGHTPEEIGGVFDFDNEYYARDAGCGCCSIFPNLYKSYGWHPGDRLLYYCKQLIAKKTHGNENYTFKELYDERGVELCIVATCLTKLSVEYFHPKISPDVPIALALRMSMGIPGFFQPVCITRFQQKYYYVDGGLLDNYCIRCFDGWFLSMETKDNFFQRLGTDDPPFEGFNNKTLGMIVYSTGEMGLLNQGVHKRYKGHKLQRPNTKLARKRGPIVDQTVAEMGNEFKVLTAAKILLQLLHDKNIDHDDKIDRHEFEEAFTQLATEYPEHMVVLFGEGFNYMEAMEAMDENKDREITFQEFIQFIQKKGVISPLSHISSVSKFSINSASEYVSSILETLLTQGERNNISESDVKRTIGIYTDYIHSLDFQNDPEDRAFLRHQARIATLNFLQEYVAENNLEQEKDFQEIATINESTESTKM